MLFKAYILAMYLLANAAWSFTCNLTIVKDSCWANTEHKVSIEVMDYNLVPPAVLTTAVLSSKQNAITTTFNCNPSQALLYRAQFEPAVWEHDKGMVYLSQLYHLPSSIKPDDRGWTLSLCFPHDFSGVPMLIQTSSLNCECVYTSIPSIMNS